MELDFVRIECEIIDKKSAQLTDALNNELRNFEAYFKSSSCLVDHKLCSSCDLQVECAYRIVFNQALSSDPETVRLHQKPSLPFSLYISCISDNTLLCTSGIIVIGYAVNYVEYFHAALLEMIMKCVNTATQSTDALLRSYSLNYLGERHEISHAASLLENVILLSGRHILQNSVHSECIKLILKSPLRLLSNGSITRRFDFAAFFCSQLRRCSSLWAYYGVGELDLDFVQLSGYSQNVTALDNSIKYIQPSWSGKLNRAGLTGTVECVGLVDPMIPLLILGSYFNAGKGASYGSGFHQIEVE